MDTYIGGGLETYDQWKERQEIQEALEQKQSPIIISHDDVVQINAWSALRHPKKHHKGWKWDADKKQWIFGPKGGVIE